MSSPSRTPKYSCSSRGWCEPDGKGEYITSNCDEKCVGWENRDVTLLAYQYDLEAALRDLSPSDQVDLVYIMTGVMRNPMNIEYFLQEMQSKHEASLPRVVKGYDRELLPSSSFSFYNAPSFFLIRREKEYTLPLLEDAIFIARLSRLSPAAQRLYPLPKPYVVVSQGGSAAVKKGRGVQLSTQEMQTLVGKEMQEGAFPTDFKDL